MRRKSDRKSKTSPEKKTPERPSRITLRRRRQKSKSSSPEHEKKPTSENEVDSTPIIESNVGSKETSNSNSEEEKQEEQPVWQVKSAETPPGGEIQKLKICLQRPSSTPERAEKSPRRHRKHRGGTSSITDEDSSEGKVKSKSSRKRRHQDNDEDIVESSSEDKFNKIQQMVKDEQNSSDSQQVSSTDIDENSKLCDKEDTAGTPPPGELNEEIVGTTSILQKSISEDDNASHHNGPESTTVIEEVVENAPVEENTKVEIADGSHVEDNYRVEESSQVEHNSPVEETSTSTTNDPQIDNNSQIEDDSKVEDNYQADQITENEPEKTLTPEQIQHDMTETKITDKDKIVKDITESVVDTNPVQLKEDESEEKSKLEATEVSESSETNSEEKTGTFEKEITMKEVIENEDTVETENQEPEKSHTPEPPINKSSNLDESRQLEVVRDESVDAIQEKKSDDSVSQEDLEKSQKQQISSEKMEVDEEKLITEQFEKSTNVNENHESINNENQINENNEKNVEISLETNNSSGDDDRSPVRSSVVSVVNQVQSTYESEPTEEQSTYVADPTRKKLKLKESIIEYIQTKTRLTSENVREICPDLKVLSLDEVRLEDDNRNHTDDDTNSLRKSKKKPFEDKKITIQTVKDSTATPTVVITPPITTNPMLANRKISIVGDESSTLHRPPSPAKNDPSPILYIKNLVRPFTLNQLKELLSRTGTIKENGFWINKIKSECFVQYETLEQSVETRNALHGVHWPVANGRRLDVDFGTEEAMEKARAPTEIKHEIKTEAPTTPEAKPKEEPVDWREVRERERLRREQRGVREWDVGKQGPDRSPSPPPIKRRQHSPPSKNATPDRKIRKKEDVPSKLLDDLFRKTKATPCIYWLPLSAEMIVIKEEQRRKHMAEHERRLAEIRRVERMRRAPGGGRSRDGGRSRYN